MFIKALIFHLLYFVFSSSYAGLFHTVYDVVNDTLYIAPKNIYDRTVSFGLSMYEISFRYENNTPDTTFLKEIEVDTSSTDKEFILNSLSLIEKNTVIPPNSKVTILKYLLSTRSVHTPIAAREEYRISVKIGIIKDEILFYFHPNSLADFYDEMVPKFSSKDSLALYDVPLFNMNYNYRRSLNINYDWEVGDNVNNLVLIQFNSSLLRGPFSDNVIKNDIIRNNPIYIDKISDGDSCGWIIQGEWGPNALKIYSNTVYSINDMSKPTQIENLITVRKADTINISFQGSKDDFSPIDYYEITQLCSGKNLKYKYTCVPDVITNNDTGSLYSIKLFADSSDYQIRVRASDMAGNKSEAITSDLTRYISPPVIVKWFSIVDSSGSNPQYFCSGDTLLIQLDSTLYKNAQKSLYADSICIQIATDTAENLQETYSWVNTGKFFSSGGIDYKELSNNNWKYPFTIDSFLENNRHYFIRAAFFDVFNNFSDWSDVKNVVCDEEIFGGDFELEYLYNSDEQVDSVLIRWEKQDDNSGINVYDIYRKNDISNSYSLVGRVGGDINRFSESIDSLGYSGSECYYKIKYEDKVGQSYFIGPNFQPLRCLRSPGMRWESDTLGQEESSKIYLDNFLSQYVKEYIIELNEPDNWDNRIIEIDFIGINDALGITRLEKDGFYSARVRLQFIDGLFSNWSNWEETCKKSTKIDIQTKPIETKIFLPYPNPSNSSIRFSYNVQSVAWVEVVIYSSMGQKVVELVNEYQQPGEYYVDWQSKNIKNVECPSGIYLCVINIKQSNTRILKKVNKLLLIK